MYQNMFDEVLNLVGVVYQMRLTYTIIINFKSFVLKTNVFDKLFYSVFKS